MNVQGGFSPMSDNNHIQHLHCHILYRAIWFQLFDVGLLKKSDSIETVLSLMEHVKSCVSEMLVYRTFWNLKGGLGKKNPKLYWNVCYIRGCTSCLFQRPVSASLHCVPPTEKPFPFALQAVSCWERTEYDISNPSRIWTSDTLPKEGFYLSTPLYAGEESCIQQAICLWSYVSRTRRSLSHLFLMVFLIWIKLLQLFSKGMRHLLLYSC